MSKIDSLPMGVLVALAACGGLAGCAGSGERLPECRGKAVPINRFLPTASVSGQPVNPALVSTAQVSEADAH